MRCQPGAKRQRQEPPPATWKSIGACAKAEACSPTLSPQHSQSCVKIVTFARLYNANRRPWGAGEFVAGAKTLALAGAEHRHSAAILRPAGNVVANRDRAFLAVGDRPHALCRDA